MALYKAKFHISPTEVDWPLNLTKISTFIAFLDSLISLNFQLDQPFVAKYIEDDGNLNLIGNVWPLKDFGNMDFLKILFTLASLSWIVFFFEDIFLHIIPEFLKCGILVFTIPDTFFKNNVKKLTFSKKIANICFFYLLWRFYDEKWVLDIFCLF